MYNYLFAFLNIYIYEFNIQNTFYTFNCMYIIITFIIYIYLFTIIIYILHVKYLKNLIVAVFYEKWNTEILKIKNLLYFDSFPCMKLGILIPKIYFETHVRYLHSSAYGMCNVFMQCVLPTYLNVYFLRIYTRMAHDVPSNFSAFVTREI